MPTPRTKPRSNWPPLAASAFAVQSSRRGKASDGTPLNHSPAVVSVRARGFWSPGIDRASVQIAIASRAEWANVRDYAEIHPTREQQGLADRHRKECGRRGRKSSVSHYRSARIFTIRRGLIRHPLPTENWHQFYRGTCECGPIR